MARRGERVERSSGAAPPRHSGASDEHNGAGELLQVTVEQAEGGASVISLAGELDLSTIPAAERRLFTELENGAGVVVDLTGLSFIDSSGIALLIQAFRAAEEGPQMHTVIAAGSQVERVFRLAGIDRALPLYLERAQALGALNGKAV
jgi:anti-sigma B factor antagonist